jgi:serine/threonine-protein kinase ATR
MNDSSSIPSSSIPLPLPTLQDERSTFFLEWIRTALAEETGGSPPVVHPSDREEWVRVISTFRRYLLSTLPFPKGWKWSLLHEKVKLIELCLKVVRRAVNSTDSLFVGYDSHAKTLFATLIDLCNVLDQWCLVAVPTEEGILSPQELRTHAVKASVELIQCLGRGVKGRGHETSSWITLVAILDECLDTCRSMHFFLSRSRFVLTNLIRLSSNCAGS